MQLSDAQKVQLFPQRGHSTLALREVDVRKDITEHLAHFPPALDQRLRLTKAGYLQSPKQMPVSQLLLRHTR